MPRTTSSPARLPSLDPANYQWLAPDVSQPARLVAGNDSLTARQAYHYLTQGIGVVWQGDFHQGKLLLQALGRRLPSQPRVSNESDPIHWPADERRALFHRHRQYQSQRSALLNRFLLPVADNGSIPLKRAPDIREACLAGGIPIQRHDTTQPQQALLPLRTLLGLIGAYEWQKKGVAVKGLPAPIHVSYGVFSPLRGEYLDLLWQAPLPSTRHAVDVGTGSGVISAILANRGVQSVVATDTNPRAIACARRTLDLMGLTERVDVQEIPFFPEGTTPLLVCNPPWLPAKPTSAIEQAIYDPDHSMLTGFLQGAAEHLEPNGEAWLIMSDLAEHLGLRSPEHIPDLIATANLNVADILQTQPRHSRAHDNQDPLHFARSRETTRLWRLRRAR